MFFREAKPHFKIVPRSPSAASTSRTRAGRSAAAHETWSVRATSDPDRATDAALRPDDGLSASTVLEDGLSASVDAGLRASSLLSASVDVEGRSAESPPSGTCRWTVHPAAAGARRTPAAKCASAFCAAPTLEKRTSALCLPSLTPALTRVPKGAKISSSCAFDGAASPAGQDTLTILCCTSASFALIAGRPCGGSAAAAAAARAFAPTLTSSTVQGPT
mmetsp:Transcript_188/g.696  ORF Transcript_188/g.696 Transcript_188/m.696 type:complete len:219 (-) Transcript_188:121-777(-)